MPFSVAGAQLPLTAFFNTQSSQQPKRKAAEPRVATRRKDPADLQRDAGPSKKRKRQKENLAISSRIAVEQQDSAECTLEDASEGNLADVSVLQQGSPSEDRLSRRSNIIDLSHSPPSSSSLPPLHTEQPPATPVAQIRPDRPLAAASLPSPPLTAPTAKRARRAQRVPGEQEGSSRLDTHAGLQESVYCSVQADGSYAYILPDSKQSGLWQHVFRLIGWPDSAGRWEQRCHCTAIP